MGGCECFLLNTSGCMDGWVTGTMNGREVAYLFTMNTLPCAIFVMLILPENLSHASRGVNCVWVLVGVC